MQKFLRRYYLLFVSVSFAAFFISFVIPFFLSLYFSFSGSLLPSNTAFLSVKNYSALFADAAFLNVLFITGKFAVICALSVNIAAYFLALFIKYVLKDSALFKSLFLMPSLISGIALGYFCQIFLSTAADAVSKLFGLEINVLGFWGLVFTFNWQLIGFMTLIYISALGSVSKEIIEAARVDGASSFRIFFSIKIPSFIPAALIAFFLSLINSFKIFEQNLAFQTLLKDGSSQFAVLDIYNTFYAKGSLESAAQSKSIIFFVIIFVLSFVFLKALNKRGINL